MTLLGRMRVTNAHSGAHLGMIRVASASIYSVLVDANCVQLSIEDRFSSARG